MTRLLLRIFLLLAAMPVPAASSAAYSKPSADLLSAFWQTVAEEARPFQQIGHQYTLSDHGLRFVWGNNGLSASSSVQQAAWQWNLRLIAYGRADQSLLLPAPHFQAQARQITYHYPGLSEWHRNTSLGLKQGFTLASPPDGEGDLVLRLALTTNLTASPSADRRSLQFTLPDGQVLHYSNLRAYDATGHPLNAWLEYGTHQIAIHVQDQGAKYPLTIDPLIYVENKLTVAEGNAGDEFGVSVAIWGDTAVIGARLADGPAGADQGAAYVFSRSNAGWALQQKLIASDGNPGDRFGFSVAIWENHIVVGSFWATVKFMVKRGAAYVFTRENGTWVQTQKIIAFDGQNNDQFGYSLAIQDGLLAIGAPTADGSVKDVGAVYVYAFNGTNWTFQQKLVAYDGSQEDYFGNSVALWNNTLLIGAPNDDIGANADQGSAYIFARTTQWEQQQKLIAADGAAGDEFGTAVALYGNLAFVGAPNADIAAQADQGAAYLFTSSGSSWGQQQKITASDGAAGDKFGISLAVNGSLLAVGARFADITGNTDVGAAYLYFMNGSGLWQGEQKITSTTGAAGDQFGNAVALFGGDVVIGARMTTVDADVQQGAAYVYALYHNDTDLSVTATATADSLQPGQAVTITIVVQNNGSTPVNDVRVNAALPANLIYSSHSTGQGTYALSSGAWLVGVLDGSSSATLILQATAVAQAGSINTFLVNLLSHDLDDSNNSARIDFRVVFFTLTPDALTFEDRLILSTSPTQMVQVTNVSGNSVTIGTLAVSTGFLLVNNTCNGQTLANGAQCSFGVQFKPLADLVYDDEVKIPVNGSNYITTLPVHGVGLPGTQLLTNLSFEKDANRDRIPDDWEKGSVWTLNDGRNCTVKRTGTCSVRFVGTGTLKSLQYVIFKSGVAGDDFLLTVWSRASNVPTTTKYYRMRLQFYNGTTLVGSKIFNFAKGTHAFVQGKLLFTAPADYTKIIVNIEFQAASGTVWFDDASLLWAP
ncbi:MAG: hypothetical protein ACP5QU_06955 [Anaerolineae bacterium]